MNKKTNRCHLDGTLLNSESKLSPLRLKPSKIMLLARSLLQQGVPIEWQIISINNWDWRVL